MKIEEQRAYVDIELRLDRDWDSAVPWGLVADTLLIKGLHSSWSGMLSVLATLYLYLYMPSESLENWVKESIGL